MGVAQDEAVPWRARDAAYSAGLGLAVVFLLFAGALALDRLPGTGVGAPQGLPAQPPAALMTGANGAFCLGTVAGVWLLVVRRYNVRWCVLGLCAPRRASLLPVLLLVALFVIGSALILLAATLVVDLLGSPALVAVEAGLPAWPGGSTGTTGGALLFVGAVLISLLFAPVAEEMLFRGVLYQALRRRTGTGVATAGSALLFALVHARPAVVPESLLLGVVLALAFERTGSLYPSMGLHAAYNGVLLLLASHVT